MFSKNPYPAKAPDVTVEYVKAVMEMHKKNGTVNSMYILFNESAEIAGLCSVCIDSFRSETLRHVGTLTAVAAKYRGKGIARYLKAKLYLKLLEENKDFKYITTDTMPWNKYMYKINNEFGFKPYIKGCSFKITKEFLENYLKLK
jgi:GNAT superfamily N-acetyltransferase